MAVESIPIDLLNPGQVFACLGFLEAADMLLGGAAARFDWADEENVRFILSTGCKCNPFEKVLEFLAGAEVSALAPFGWRPAMKPKKPPKNEKERKRQENARLKLERELTELVRTELTPSRTPETSAALPVRIRGSCGGQKQAVTLTHWADSDAGRNDFKLYAGNRSGLSIATAMIRGTRSPPRKGQNIGSPQTNGIMQLWEEDRKGLVKAPLDVLTPMGGSFNFDPRGAWTAIDVGYSPNEQNHAVQGSPVAELLAAWGLEHARPVEFGVRQVRYAVWATSLPPLLARAAFCASLTTVPLRRYRFELDLSGKNKVVTVAKEEPQA